MLRDCEGSYLTVRHKDKTCQHTKETQFNLHKIRYKGRITHVKRMGGFKLCYKLKEDLPKARCKKMNETLCLQCVGNWHRKDTNLWFIM